MKFNNDDINPEIASLSDPNENEDIDVSESESEDDSSYDANGLEEELTDLPDSDQRAILDKLAEITDSQQRTIAEKLISDILRLAREGELTSDTSVIYDASPEQHILSLVQNCETINRKL